MRIKNLFKYLFRFLSLQIILTLITIYYFDNFLIWDESFKYEIYLNLIEDKNRFFPFVDDIFITVDGVLILLIFVFLIIIYSTNFYTYVNELSFSMNRNLLGEYFQIYLLWTSYLMVSFFILRFNNLFRGSLLLFSFLIPVILMIFRNTEFISSLLGRAVTNETYISFNLDDNSKFRNLRIMTFRKNLGSYFINENNTEKEILKNFNDSDFAVTDLSHSKAIIEIEGPNVKEVLKKGCPFNFNIFSKNMCINSSYNGISFLVDMVEDDPEKARIFSLRSFGESMYHSITDASLEYGYKCI